MIATVEYLGFVVLLFIGSRLLPGSIHAGAELLDGSRRYYKLNGLLLLILLPATVAGAPWLVALSLSAVYRDFWALFAVANVFAVGLTGILFLQGRSEGTGRWLHDLFYGTELNPTWLGVDLKMFSYRPSLMGLVLFNAAFAAEQYRLYGAISTRMALYQAFTFLYVVNYFQFEHGMLFTWNVIAERFGFMLVWGDYVLVPFFYSIAGWYLVDQWEPISNAAVAGLVLLYLAGFWLFRGANGQKHRFKTNPQGTIWGRPAEALGGKLLVSGFWGVGRKLNYTGELCVYYAWTLTCGFDSLVPYLLPAWLTLLLTHRAWRDEQRCREKYGPLWTAYCGRARFRMVPFIY